jgi:hypothetical protein
VYTSNAIVSVLDVEAGDVVKITGRVVEFNGLTQLSNVSAFVKSGSTAIPDPVAVTLPVTPTTPLEQYEGMLVSFPQQLVISEYFNFDQFGEIVVSLPLDGLARPFVPTSYVQPGPEAAAVATALTLCRITLDDGRSEQNPDPVRHPNGKAFTLDNRFRGGDKVQNATGILDYRFNLYRIQPTQGAEYTSANPRTGPEEVAGRLKVAAFNVLNYFTTLNENGNRTPPGGEPRGANNAEEFARQRAKIIAAISVINADVVGLIEIQNNDAAIKNLVAGLNAEMGAGTYDFLNTGVIGTDEIKVAFIYKPATVSLVGEYKVLTTAIDPRFIDSRNRPALAQTFREKSSGEVMTVAVNHFKSKGSDCGAGDDDRLQGNCNGTRTQAALALVDWLAKDPTGSGDADFMIIGDLNSYDEEDPIDTIRAGADDQLGTEDDFVDLIEQYQGEFAYSYGFDGQFGYLDYALASKSLTAQTTGATEWHINSDEPDLLDYDMSFKKPAQEALYEPNPFRASDHDPAIVGLALYTPVVNFANAAVTVNEGAGSYTVNLSLSEKTYQLTTVIITLETAGASSEDFTTTPAAANKITLNIPVGSKSASFTMDIVDDQIDELDETITFILGEVSQGLAKGSQLTSVVTIGDNDVLAISFSQPAATIEERSGTYTVTLPLSIKPVTDQTVTVKIDDNEFVYGKNDYTTSPNGAGGSFDLLIPAGSTSVSFTVTPDKNAVKKKFEQNIVFTLTHPSAGLQIGTLNTFTLTVVDEKSNGLNVKNYVVWPNPTTGPITLSTNIKDYLDDKVKVTLRSDRGEILYAGTGYLPVLSYQLSNRLRNGKPGFYLVEVDARGTVTQIRVLKQ